jgi:hypothetical protein
MDFNFGKAEYFSRAGLTRFLGGHSSGKSVLQQTYEQGAVMPQCSKLVQKIHL